MSEIRICKYCGMELSEGIPHGLRECHLRAVARIAELEEKQRWIPVSERLPEFGDVVLVCDSKGYVNKDFRYEADGKWKLTDFVRHWMPLPEPPEVQE